MSWTEVEKARTTEEELSRIYRARFSSFIIVIVIGFSNGSTVTDASVSFNTESSPSIMEVTTTVSPAPTNLTTFARARVSLLSHVDLDNITIIPFVEEAEYKLQRHLNATIKITVKNIRRKP
ncbi:hypothetical protein AAFF_G00265340 [Aldrovandia affinis]|uniref:Uncharacterized protein n=1 Tax=Aldrovandia affinis TaxID=143900 RepID=A0AAD7RC26_9TELE|nr:hypothetical protein AAFF_G00265340 [Aldrovandia affinis]